MSISVQDPFGFHLVGSTWQCHLCKTCLVSVCVNAIHVIQEDGAGEETTPEKKKARKTEQVPGSAWCVKLRSHVFICVLLCFHAFSLH